MSPRIVSLIVAPVLLATGYGTSAAAIDGAAPGALSLGPIMTTRMACPEPASSIEDRFLAQLGGVTGYGFLLGERALRYELDGRPDVMLFRAMPAKLEGP